MPHPPFPPSESPSARLVAPRLRITASLRSTGGNPLFLMFHGYGNDEQEMVRILDAAVPGADYLSFRGTYDRPYMGGAYWYPDGCGVEERRLACSAVGRSVASLLDASAFANRQKVLVGFSQGGYLAYRLVLEHPDLFDAAILLSPSFRGEEHADPATLGSRTAFLLLYGTEDRVIPPADQSAARRVLGATGRATYREYPGMGHAVCDEEIADIRAFAQSLAGRQV